MAYYLVEAERRSEERLAVEACGAAGERRVPFHDAPASVPPSRSRCVEPASVPTAEWFGRRQDYCSPPLAQERAAVLDEYFEDLRVTAVQRNEGWASDP